MSFSVTASHTILDFGKQGIGNVDYSKILLAWIVTSFFFGLENDFYLYTEHGSMGHSSILDLSFGWTGASFGSCYGLIPAHLVWSKRHEEETDGQTR